MNRRTDRRRFLRDATLLGSGIWIAGRTSMAGAKSANDKLNIGIIGAGGRGASNLGGVQSENIMALCDVDEKRAADAFERFPKARRYYDYRKMLEAEKDLDAVVVSTPDHNHAPAAVMAMRLGRHVYCEKPLTHSVHEARTLRETAALYNVVTQMGNQGHSMDGSRRSVEIIRSGAIGDVSEVHVWSDRPIWPQGMDRPSESMAVPEHLKWNEWLGPAPERPYHSAYLPFNWRGWWDFGTGALGDMACHCADVAFWSLKLEDPIAIEAESPPVNDETPPKWSIIRYDFAARGNLPPCRMTWYDGRKLPPADLVGGGELPSNGTILVGDKGTLLINDPYGVEIQLLPKEKFAEYEAPEPTLPRAPDGSHHREWIEACKASDPAKALSNFEYSTRLTETVLLGNVAIRAGKRIEWDAANMRVTNVPEADEYLRREYRSGWTL